jgi:type I restriction enzyme S subunit
VNQFAHDKLPPAWAEAPLRELATTITKGSTPTTYGHDYKETGISFVRVENLAQGCIDRETLTAFIDESANAALRRSQLQMGDVLYSIAGTIGRTAIVREQDLPANTNQALAIIRGTDTVVFPSYLIHFLSSSTSQQRTLLRARGGAMNNISLSDIEKIVVPVAPRPEQKRIVEEIDKHFTRLDAGVVALKRVQTNLKRYRNAVLKAAYEGRLVPTEAELAKREGRSYESATRLLGRILGERRAQWEVAQANGKKTKYKDPPGLNLAVLSNHPEGWEWASLGSIAELKGGLTKGQRRKPTEIVREVPYLRVANVQRGYIDLDEVKTIDATEEEIRELRLENGDVLFCLGMEIQSADGTLKTRENRPRISLRSI